jgi:xanthine dehydrogenase accessory factor
VKQPLFDTLTSDIGRTHALALVTVIAGRGGAVEIGRQLLVDAAGDPRGSLGDPALDKAARMAAAEAITSFQPRRLAVGEGDERVSIFVDVYPPRRTLIAIGGVHVAIPLLAFARTLGMRTIVIDPRTAFATPERFPDVDLISHQWPGQALETIGLSAGSYVTTLSHDDKLDIPALAAAVRSPARYIGALGSRKTHAKRVIALRELGCDDTALARIDNPIGLPLGGRRAEEIAVSIMAQIVAVDHAVRLTRTAEPAAS